MRNKVLIAALALAVAVLISLHLRMPHGTQTWRMTASEALARNSEKMPVAMPQIGITRVWISCLEFNYHGVNKRRSHRISLDEVERDDEIYSIMEHDLDRVKVPLSLVSVRFVRIMLEIELNGVKRRMAIEVRKNSCTLKSNADELRKIGERFLQETGIDVQPNLF